MSQDRIRISEGPNEQTMIWSKVEGRYLTEDEVLKRTIKIDPFVWFLIAYIGCKTVYAAAKEIGMTPQRLNTYATRGVRSIPAMVKLAEEFGVPISIVGQWISDNIDMLATPGSETDLIEIAS